MGIRGVTLSHRVATHHCPKPPSSDLGADPEQIELIGKRIARELVRRLDRRRSRLIPGQDQCPGRAGQEARRWDERGLRRGVRASLSVCCLASEMEEGFTIASRAASPSYGAAFTIPSTARLNTDVNGCSVDLFDPPARSRSHGQDDRSPAAGKRAGRRGQYPVRSGNAVGFTREQAYRSSRSTIGAANLSCSRKERQLPPRAAAQYSVKPGQW